MPRVVPAEFPHPRYDRALTGALGLAGLAGGAIPRTRLIPFQFNETANSRRTVSTPGLQGPAILRKIWFQTGVHVTPPQESVELGWALFPFAEAGVPLTTPRPYTLLTELQDPFGVSVATIGQGYPSATLPNTLTDVEKEVNILIPEERFVFCLALVNNGANAQEWQGRFTVVEGLDLTALPSWLGA